MRRGHIRVGFWFAAVLLLVDSRCPALAGETGAVAEAPAPAPITASDPDLAAARNLEREIVDVVDRVRRATVSVFNRRREPKGEPNAPVTLSGVGSGVVISYRGTWIVTNVHVVRDADLLEIVGVDGRTRRATVKARSDIYDLAVLTWEGKIEGVEAVPLFRAGRTLDAGQIVIATGNPFLLANDGACVPTLGVVSGRARWMEADVLHGRTLQHDAAVNPGNSGGPLWTRDGDLVGINETIATHSRSQGSGPCSTGASYSICIDQVQRVVADLLDPVEERSASWRGLVFSTSRNAQGRADGAEACDACARAGSRFHALGLAPGDVVVGASRIGSGSFGGEPASRAAIRTAKDLARWLETTRAGTMVRIEVRAGESVRAWSGPFPAP